MIIPKLAREEMSGQAISGDLDRARRRGGREVSGELPSRHWTRFTDTTAVAAVALVAILGVLAFDWFFLPPTHSLGLKGSAWGAFAAYVALVLVLAAVLLRARRSGTRYDRAVRRLAGEQAALRRVATLVAREPSPSEVFAVVADEVAEILEVPIVVMSRYERDGTAAVIGAHGSHPFQAGTVWALDGLSVAGEVRRTGEPSRLSDYGRGPGTIADVARETGISSTVGVPITVEGRLWGVIVVATTGHAPLPRSAETRLADFTELVAVAVSNAQARGELSLLVDEQAALRRVATLVAQEGDPLEVFAVLAEETRRTLDLPMIEMSRYESDGTVTVIGAAGDHPFQAGTRWPLDGPTVAALIRATGKPATVDYAGLGGTIAEAARRGGLRKGFGVPIVVNGAVWGAMATASLEEDPLSTDAESRLAEFTDLVAIAIANTQTRDDLRRLADEQAALRHVATLVARGALPEEIFAAVAAQVAQLLDVPAISMVRFEADQSSTAIAVYGDENPFGAGATFEPYPGVMRQVRLTGRSARLEDFAHTTGPTTARLQAARIHSGVGVPITVDGKIWGTIIALATGGRSLPEGIEPRLARFTDLVATAISNTQARGDLELLANEQRALRNIATLVARGAEPAQVFDAVCQVTGALVAASSVNLCEFTADGFNLTLAGWSLRDTHVPTGTRLPLAGDTINGVIYGTALPARVDSYEAASGELGTLIRERGIRSEVGAPVIVDGVVWGALIAGTDADEPLPATVEARLAGFAELVATAIANATNRAELIASRARIVTAGDEARRRVERNLHDGTQQRLVSLGLDLRSVAAGLAPGEGETRNKLERIGGELEALLEEVRELSRGLHPALLAQQGLPPALRALARRSPLPVELQIDVPSRLPQSVEIATYYVVSEALTNAAKYSLATEITVRVESSGKVLTASIADDGVGGADTRAGSGLIGLRDRVEALGGRFILESPSGRGTHITIELPLDRVRSEHATMSNLPRSV